MKPIQRFTIISLAVLLAAGMSGCAESADNTASEAAAVTETSNSEERTEEKTDSAAPIKITMTTSYDIRTDDDGKMLVSSRCPVISCGEESGYDALAASLSSWSEEISQSWKKETDDLFAQAQSSGSLTEGSYYTDVTEGKVVRADTNAVSILLSKSVNSGGAHPSCSYSAATFDTHTGKELSFSDVLQEGKMETLPDLLKEKLQENYPEETFYVDDISAAIKEEMDAGDGPVWTLGYEGITFTFAPDELAPYAAGSQSVTLSYADYPDLVKTEYTEAAENYIEAFDLDESVALPGSGKELIITDTPADDSDDYTFTVSLDDAVYIEVLHGYVFSPYLIHKDGRNYLYLQYSLENDWKSMQIFDLNGDTLSAPQEFERWFRTDSPTDPDHMELASRTDMLSTNGIWREYYAGQDGIPVSEKDWDYIEGDLASTLTTKKEITAQVRSEEDGEGTEETIPAGTALTFYATDDDTWVDFKDGQGRFVRIQVEKKDGMDYVGGVSAEEIFDGMMFAG